MIQRICEDIPDDLLGIIIGFSQNGTVVSCSEDGLRELGYVQEDEFTISQLMPVFKEKSMQEIQASLKTEGEYIAYRKNQTSFFVKVLLKQCHYGNAEYLCRLIPWQEHKRLEKEVEQTNRKLKEALQAKNEMISNTTHELRTPLNGIKGQIDYLMMQTEMTEEQDKTLQIVMQCCANMQQIINDILDFSKMEAGKIKLERLQFSLKNVMNYVVDTNIKQANAKGIQLNVHISEEIPEQLYGDGLRLGQILNNLISNGVKFTSFGSVRVEVNKVASSGNRIELLFMVIDTGIGISPENQTKLFKSFSQVDGSITRKYGGTGLGLAISKELVSMMDGFIHLESEVGRGSTFAFTAVLHTDDKPETEVVQKQKYDFTKLLFTKYKENSGAVYVWNSPENKLELKQDLEKLVLSIEILNWNRVEIFAQKIKELMQGAEQEILKQLIKMEMAIRREDHDRSLLEYEQLVKILKDKDSV